MFIKFCDKRLAPFYTLKLIPSHVGRIEGELLGLIGFGLLAVWWAALPFWATGRDSTLRTKWVTGAGVVLLAYLASFSALGYWR